MWAQCPIPRWFCPFDVIAEEMGFSDIIAIPPGLILDWKFNFDSDTQNDILLEGHVFFKTVLNCCNR